VTAATRRSTAASRYVLKIRHGCRTETLSDGKITVSADVDYQLIVDAGEVTLRALHVELPKVPCRPNEEFVPSYYDINLDKLYEVKTDEDLTLMWGKHLGSRTVLMLVHIVNKETGGEIVVNDFTSAQTTQASIHQLPVEYNEDAN
jgi:hypothetical protein